MKNLISLRKRFGKTQKDMAEYLGISRQAYAHYETDNREPDIDTIKQLSDYFDVSSDILIDRIDLSESTSTKIHLFSSSDKLSSNEQEVITAYREHPEMHDAVHRLLGISENEPPLRIAAAPKVNPAIIDLDSDGVSHT